ncbi:uncharacterized protein LOC128710967 [Anopheles marshallii]|uniref:uncharacterized protein LOC128710967 n=1 Tax=Anopheles marshallii TaxID=1521116 RepID=UPI00237A8612|nr:uncharacterized protein LOC128710967 [Anopheles marshallii]
MAVLPGAVASVKWWWCRSFVADERCFSRRCVGSNRNTTRCLSGLRSCRYRFLVVSVSTAYRRVGKMRKRDDRVVLLLVVVCAALVPAVSGQQQRFRQQTGPVNRRSSFAEPAPIPATPAHQAEFQTGQTFSYNPAAAAVTELARVIGSILGQQNKAAVFSPVSIACALSLMLIGAEQETKNELIQVLGFQQYRNHLDNIHELYGQMLKDLAKTEFGRTPPRWRTANPCYDDDDEEEAAAAAAEFPPTKDIIRVTNAVFVQEGFPLNASFTYYSNRFYSSTAANVPFATNPARAAAFINAWAHRSTEGKIRDILSESVAAEAEMIVASALYFKALWSEPFERQATELKPFYPDGHGRDSKLVPTMSTVGCYPYYDAREYDAKIVGLSYQGNKTAMYIIMPNNSTRQTMLEFQRRLTPLIIGELVSKMTQRKMFLQMPKMQITNTINLREVLQQLGLQTIFKRGQSNLSGMVAMPQPVLQFATRFGESGAPADPTSVVFPVDEYHVQPASDIRRGTGMNNINAAAGESGRERVPGAQLHVSEFIHRVELDINEKGTEGGAITSSTIFRALPSVHFRIDAPFLLLIGHDDTRLPLFYGSIYDPTPKMKLFQALSLTLWLLLVPLVHGQWNRYNTPKPFSRITPMVRARFPARLSFDGGPTPAPTSSTTRRPAAPPTNGNAATSLFLAPDNDSKVSQNVVDFMMRISRTLARRNSKTEIFSPVSIITVANLLFLGSAGDTHAEFGKVLTPSSMNWKQLHHRYGKVLANLVSAEPVDSRRDQWRRQTCPLDEDYDDEPTTPTPKSQVIRVANGIFYQKDLQMRQQYVALARSLYGALVQPIDPQKSAASTAMINKWVSDVTAGKIRNMIEGPLSPSSSVVIANALYFKGKWKTQFEPLVTRESAFFPNGIDKPSYRVTMMSMSGCLPFYNPRDALDVSIVGLPYRDDTSTMYLIQPANSSRTALRRLQASLTGKMVDSWIAQMKLLSTTVRLPKMHLKNSVDLLQSFQKLGFNSILSPAKSDLSNMVSSGATGQKPYANQILHKLDLTIDEEGTEGAAATSALVDRIGSQRTFNGNTPFLIYLRHDATGLPLFYGPIFDPR